MSLIITKLIPCYISTCIICIDDIYIYIYIKYMLWCMYIISFIILIIIKLIIATKISFNYLFQSIFNISILCKFNYREILCFNISVYLESYKKLLSFNTFKYLCNLIISNFIIISKWLNLNIYLKYIVKMEIKIKIFFYFRK